MSKLEAVIEIGSTASRLLVAEIQDAGAWQVIDQADLPTQLGRDVFTTGSISRDSLLQCLHILDRFSEQLSAWDIPQESVSCIATSAFREAANRDTVLDRILTKTGYMVRVIDGVEENRLMYLSVSDCLKDCSGSNLMNENSIILDVGGGSTELMLIEKGKMAAAHSFRLGTVIVEQKLHTLAGDLRYTKRLLEDFIANARTSLDAELSLANIRQFIATGSEAALAAESMGSQLSPQVRNITREGFTAFVERTLRYSIEECAATFKISSADASALRISLLCAMFFLQLTGSRRILVPKANIREGLILSKINRPNPASQDDFYAQIIASAQNLARKYKCDEQHSEYVRQTAARLFDSLRAELALGNHERMLLEVTAILHDIGMFIHGSDHEAHSRYIIAHSEIFGLNKEEVEIVSRVALIHRGSVRAHSAEDLPRRSDRVLILKLAAILRVADALDRGHAQKFTDFEVAIQDGAVVIRSACEHSDMLEKIALAEKSDLFESVFGYKVYLE